METKSKKPGNFQSQKRAKSFLRRRSVKDAGELKVSLFLVNQLPGVFTQHQGNLQMVGGESLLIYRGVYGTERRQDHRTAAAEI